jgi:hypothetical protein
MNLYARVWSRGDAICARDADEIGMRSHVSLKKRVPSDHPLSTIKALANEALARRICSLIAKDSRWHRLPRAILRETTQRAPRDTIFAPVNEFYRAGARQFPAGSAAVTIFYRFSSLSSLARHSPIDVPRAERL